MAKLLNATILADVKPDGLQSTGVILYYDQAALHAAENYQVEGREITGIQCDGSQITLKLAHTAKNTMLQEVDKDGFPLRREAPRQLKGADGDKEAMTGPVEDGRHTAFKIPVLTVSTPEGIIHTNGFICPVMEKFQLFTLDGSDYLLYVPEKLEEGRKYPLVLYVPDARGIARDPRVALAVTCGGTVWAEESWQREHPCFVLVPAFKPMEILTHDDFSYHKKLLLIPSMIREVTTHYPVDNNRIYGVGASMGCMTNCQLDIIDPELFAAQILVAGQWDAAACGKAMKDKPLWILVSDGDLKAHPGMDAITEAIVANGGEVTHYTWDAKKDNLEKKAKEALEDDSVCRYVVFAGNSVIPDGEPIHGGTHHIFSFPVAYSIHAIREWLFTNRKE